jgi:hypothetical protein
MRLPEVEKVAKDADKILNNSAPGFVWLKNFIEIFNNLLNTASNL